jgi:hypothetical protein
MGEIDALLSASELSSLAVLGDTTSQVFIPAATNPPPITAAVAPYDRVEEGVSNSERSSLVARSAGDSPRGSMFINVRCRNHEDGKRFDLTGGVVYNVPLDAGGRRAFRKQKDESLEEFEMYVQKIVSKPKVPLLLTPARVLISSPANAAAGMSSVRACVRTRLCRSRRATPPPCPRADRHAENDRRLCAAKRSGKLGPQQVRRRPQQVRRRLHRRRRVHPIGRQRSVAHTRHARRTWTSRMRRCAG